MKNTCSQHEHICSQHTRTLNVNSSGRPAHRWEARSKTRGAPYWWAIVASPDELRTISLRMIIRCCLSLRRFVRKGPKSTHVWSLLLCRAVELQSYGEGQAEGKRRLVLKITAGFKRPAFVSCVDFSTVCYVGAVFRTGCRARFGPGASVEADSAPRDE